MAMRIWSIIGRFAALAALGALAAACSNPETVEAPAQGTSERAAVAQEAGGEGAREEVKGEERLILALGDSLFAGYGVGREASYPARLEQALRARGINARVINAGVSGDTSAAGRARLAFTLDALERKPDLVIIELGGNDLLRRISPEETRRNLDAMLQELERRQIRALLMGMRAPPNYGPEYQARFDALYAELAREHDVALVPFFLEPIYRDPAMFQSDRIHPTREGIDRLVAATLDAVAQALPRKSESAR